MQCEVTPARRSPQLALLIVTALATMAVSGAFIKQQNELDRQGEHLRRAEIEITALKAPKWMGFAVEPTAPSDFRCAPPDRAAR